MPYLTPQDIASYIHCPLLLADRNRKRVAQPLTFFEEYLRKVFIEGERNALLTDSVVVARKLIKTWDKTWWPAAIASGMSMKETKALTLLASLKITDYCKYDISDYEFPTVGVDTTAETTIGRHTLTASADIIKVDFTTKHKTTVLVNFTNERMDVTEAGLDIAAKACAYAFYTGKGERVSHIYVDISGRNNKTKMVTATFDSKEIDLIRKMLYHVDYGISTGAFYANPHHCKECNQCRSSKS